MNNMPDGFSWQYGNVDVSRSIENEALLEVFTSRLNDYIRRKAASIPQSDWKLPDKYEQAFPLSPGEVQRIFAACANLLATGDAEYSASKDVEYELTMDYFYEVEVEY